jgi:hypothetical protein
VNPTAYTLGAGEAEGVFSADALGSDGGGGAASQCQLLSSFRALNLSALEPP